MNKTIKIRITGEGGSGKSYFANFVKTEFPKYSKDKVKMKFSFICFSDEGNGNLITIKRK